MQTTTINQLRSRKSEQEAGAAAPACVLSLTFAVERTVRDLWRQLVRKMLPGLRLAAHWGRIPPRSESPARCQRRR